jgi:dTDP-4-dehydrorhamnose reductase
MNDMRPILVAGRAGQLARCLVEQGRASGFAMIARGRPELDLAHPATAEQVVTAINPRAVVNAAAYTAVDQAETEPELAFTINRDGAAHLAAAAVRHGIPFIHVSTDYVFDGTKEAPYEENDAPSPLNVYGRSKLEGELAVRERNPAALVLRTSSVYSPYGHNFVRTMLRLAEIRDEIRVVNDQKAAPTSASELAKAILAILKRLIENGVPEHGIYHLAGSGAATWFEFAAAIFSGSARRGWRAPKLAAISTAEYPTPAKRPMNSALNCDKALRAFGVRLPAWRESLENCLDRIAVNQESARC